jgi:hypothetical protein
VTGRFPRHRRPVGGLLGPRRGGRAERRASWAFLCGHPAGLFLGHPALFAAISNLAVACNDFIEVISDFEIPSGSLQR